MGIKITYHGYNNEYNNLVYNAHKKAGAFIDGGIQYSSPKKVKLNLEFIAILISFQNIKTVQQDSPIIINFVFFNYENIGLKQEERDSPVFRCFALS